MLPLPKIAIVMAKLQSLKLRVMRKASAALARFEDVK